MYKLDVYNLLYQTVGMSVDTHLFVYVREDTSLVTFSSYYTSLDHCPYLVSLREEGIYSIECQSIIEYVVC